MEKINSAKVAEVLADAAALVRQVTQERDTAIEKLAAIELRRECEKLAHDMHTKGLTDAPTEQVIAELEKAAGEGRLQKMKDAVEMVGPDMWSKLASPTDDRTRTGGAGTSDLEQYLAGGLG